MCKYSFVNDRPRSEWEHLITEWVHDERDRAMLSRRLLDGLTMEALSEEFCLSVVGAKKRVYRAQKQLLCHI